MFCICVTLALKRSTAIKNEYRVFTGTCMSLSLVLHFTELSLFWGMTWEDGIVFLSLFRQLEPLR